jgi:hypothetical protein
VDPCEHGNEPSVFIKGRRNFWTSEEKISFSRRTLIHGVNLVMYSANKYQYTKLSNGFHNILYPAISISTA